MSGTSGLQPLPANVDSIALVRTGSPGAGWMSAGPLGRNTRSRSATCESPMLQRSAALADGPSFFGSRIPEDADLSALEHLTKPVQLGSVDRVLEMNLDIGILLQNDVVQGSDRYIVGRIDKLVGGHDQGAVAHDLHRMVLGLSQAKEA